MFFSEKIKSIKETDRVLEIGPGGLPHPRADVFLELKMDDKKEAEAQRGYAKKADITKPVVYYDGYKFPFMDNEFDYVICSHVIEHVPYDQLGLFISEMQRVALKGYIEFPTVFYELINFQPVHLYLMNYRNGTILFMDKNKFKSNNIHKIFRQLFYCSDGYMNKAFEMYKELFFIGFEWSDSIKFAFVDSYDELVDNKDYEMYVSRFTEDGIVPINSNLHVEFSIFRKIAKKIYNVLIRFWKKTGFWKKYCSLNICKTAILDKKELIQIASTAEIKDYVIIRTYENPVVIGSYTQVNPFCVIYGGSGVYIGNNVMIAPHCMIAAGNHDYKQIDKPIRFAGNLTSGPIIIEDNVWIGANCTICDGVRIGRDSVVAANSVVNKDVQPYDIVAGAPAKVLGNRRI